MHLDPQPLLPLATAGADEQPAPPAAANPLEAKAKVAAQKFEGFFIAEMLRQMRRTTREIGGEDGILKSGSSNDMLDMADTLLADSLAGQHAFGIADVILRQLLPTLPGATGQAGSTPPQAAAKAFKFTPPPVALDK